jgi:hypothetical protein
LPKHAPERAARACARRSASPLLVLASLTASALLITGCVKDKTASVTVDTPDTPPAGTAPPPSPPTPPSRSKVTLSWARPTSNEDGSALTNLGGYRVYYGQVPHDWSTRLEIAPDSTSVEIGGLTAGTWFFAVTTFNSVGAESDFSSVASTTIGT